MGNTLTLAAIEWWTILGTTPLEIIATLSSAIGLYLIARQKPLGWPLGLIWASISAYLAFTVWHLVSDGILYLIYIPILLYFWVVWVRRGKKAATTTEKFIPTWLPWKLQLALVVAAVLSVIAWAHGIKWLDARFTWFPTPALLWRDSITTVFNFYGQYLQGRKRMENWIIWVIVNTLGAHIYWVKGSPIYATQYLMFLGLGLYGWWEWNRFRQKQPLK